MNDFLSKVKEIDVSDIKEKYYFILSFGQLLRNILFVLLISSNAIYYLITSSKTLVRVLAIFILIYSAYIVYRVLSFRIQIKGNYLYYNKEKIDLKLVQSLSLEKKRLYTNKFGLCLVIISENKEYNVSLEISRKYLFVALISAISKVEVRG